MTKLSNNKIKNIVLFTGSRSEYGLLRKLTLMLTKSNSFRTKLIVSGSHLSNEIKKDNFIIAKKINLNFKQSSSIQVNLNFAKVCNEVGKFIQSNKIDLFFVIGDRYETFAASTAAYINNIPIAHLHGGEKTIDSLDDNYRHAISKFSKIHFVAHHRYKSRLIQLGEESKKIFVVGGLGAEAISDFKFIKKEKLEKTLKLNFNNKIIIINFYPEISNIKLSLENLKNILKSISKINNVTLIFTLPSHDIGNDIFKKKILKFCKSHSNAYVFKSLGQHKYLSLLNAADLMIGNSSSGILEMPSFNKFTINLGNRQSGRIISNSVINLKSAKKNLTKIIKLKLHSKNFKNRNSYYKKNTTKQIFTILKKLDTTSLSKIKIFNDIDIISHHTK